MKRTCAPSHAVLQQVCFGLFAATLIKLTVSCVFVCSDLESEEDRPEAAAPELSPERLYDCVICNQTTPSTKGRPLLLVSLLQSSSSESL